MQKLYFIGQEMINEMNPYCNFEHKALYAIGVNIICLKEVNNRESCSKRLDSTLSQAG